MQLATARLDGRPRSGGIGLNYTGHADDLAVAYPDEPASFIKGDHTIRAW